MAKVSYFILRVLKAYTWKARNDDCTFISVTMLEYPLTNDFTVKVHNINFLKTAISLLVTHELFQMMNQFKNGSGVQFSQYWFWERLRQSLILGPLNSSAQPNDIENKAFMEQILKHVQQNDMQKAQESFEKLLSIEAKREILLNQMITPKQVEELLSNDQGKNNIDVLNEEIIDKLKLNCNELCKKSQDKVLSKVSEVEKRSEDLKDAMKKEKLKNYFNKTRYGILAMSDTDSLDNVDSALDEVSNAIQKFADLNNQYLSDYDRAMLGISGALDIANGISTFLPPPFNIITPIASKIFNLFLIEDSGPDNQDVIDAIQNGFETQRNFIQSEFQKQRDFISDQFVGQANLIRRSFGQQAQLITREFDKTRLFMFGQFVQLRDFIEGRFRERVIEKFEEMNIFASVLLEEFAERFTFAQGFGTKEISDDEAREINGMIEILDNIKEVAEIRLFILHKCFPELKSCNKNNLKGPCLFMIYTLTAIEKQRDITLLTIINILQSTNLKNLIDGYLRIQKRRKEQNRNWLKDVFLDKRVGCIITNQWHPDKWTPMSAQKEVLDFINYTDPSLREEIEAFNSSDKMTYCLQLNSTVWWTGNECEGKEWNFISYQNTM